MNEEQEKVFEGIITHFKQNGNECDLVEYLKSIVNENDVNFYYDQLIKKYKYVEIKIGTHLCYLNEEGKKFESFKELRRIEESDKKADSDLKWYQTENAKKVFEDYPKINLKANITLTFLIIYTIVTALMYLRSCR